MTLLYMFFGLIVGAGVIGLVFFSSKKGLSVKWYDWLMGVIGVLLLVFTIQNAVTALEEEQRTASGMYLVFPGIISLILLVVAALSIMRHPKSTPS